MTKIFQKIFGDTKLLVAMALPGAVWIGFLLLHPSFC